jgi:hypothetical protein
MNVVGRGNRPDPAVLTALAHQEIAIERGGGRNGSRENPSLAIPVLPLSRAFPPFGRRPNPSPLLPLPGWRTQDFRNTRNHLEATRLSSAFKARVAKGAHGLSIWLSVSRIASLAPGFVRS